MYSCKFNQNIKNQRFSTDDLALTMVRGLGLSAGGRTLRLTHTSVADEGRYTCVVTSAAGEASKDFDLSVLGKYVIIFSYSRRQGDLLYTSLVF